METTSIFSTEKQKLTAQLGGSQEQIPVEIGSQEARGSNDVPSDSDMVPAIIDGFVESPCLMDSEQIMDVHLALSDSSEYYAYQWYLSHQGSRKEWKSTSVHAGLRHPEKRRECGIETDIVFSVDSTKGGNVEDVQEPTLATPSMFDCVDLSRIPPRWYLENDIALDSIRKEIFGLLSSSTKNAQPPLELVRFSDVRWEDMPRFHTTLAVRLKGNGVVESRLCLRGG